MQGWVEAVEWSQLMMMFDLSFLWKAEQTGQQGLSIPAPQDCPQNSSREHL